MRVVIGRYVPVVFRVKGLVGKKREADHGHFCPCHVHRLRNSLQSTRLRLPAETHAMAGPVWKKCL